MRALMKGVRIGSRMIDLVESGFELAERSVNEVSAISIEAGVRLCVARMSVTTELNQ